MCSPSDPFLMHVLFVFLLVLIRDPDTGQFSMCVQISQFRAMMDHGNYVDVAQRYDEWVVESQCYTLEDLEKDIAARVKWGSRQQLAIFEYDVVSGGERKLLDDNDLSVAFAASQVEKKMFLLVCVEDKPTDLVSGSAVTEVMSNMTIDNGNATAIVSSNEPTIGDVINWDTIEITPIKDDQIGSAFYVMDEDAMYEFVGLKADDEKAEKEGAEMFDIDLEGAELPVDNHIPGEECIIYDREDPPMAVGTIYSCMTEFRTALRQHAIKGQFEYATEKSCKDLFRGHCKADGCTWSIVARLIAGQKQVRV